LAQLAGAIADARCDLTGRTRLGDGDFAEESDFGEAGPDIVVQVRSQTPRCKSNIFLENVFAFGFSYCISTV
jgi:hypothetical protein